MNEDLISIKKPECLGCVYLIGDMSKEKPDVEKTCRKEQGCPAEYMRIVVGTNMDAQAVKLAEAWQTNNTKNIEEIMRGLKKMHPRIKDEVFQRAKGKLRLAS